MKVLITGDSHTASLYAGQQQIIDKGTWPQEIDMTIRPLGGGHIFPTPFFVDKGDYAEMTNPAYRKQFERLPPLNLENCDVIYGLSGPLHTARVRRSRAWSEFAPPKLLANETPVSNQLIRQVMLDDYNYQLDLIDIILRTQDNFFVVESPRPFRHDTCLKFIRPEVLLYVDSFYRNMVKQELKLRNVAIIELNTDCYDDEGFMLDHFRHPNEDDVHHGNADFGELMIKNVLNYLQSGKE